MKVLTRAGPEERRAVLITGGAGFIGTNLAHRLLAGGNSVIVFDNLTRRGAERNLRWLRAQHKERLTVVVGDVRDERAIQGAVRQTGQVFHFAAQTAVSTSLADPVTDFDVNARGTLNVLEAVRRADRAIPVLFASTHEVYGALPELPLVAHETRYAVPPSSRLCDGIDEQRCIEFERPHGCSKAAAEQYVLDYARTFGLPTTVFRLGCVYGPHGCVDDDCGSVAHIVGSAVRGETIALYGDGKHVRDILFVEDLIDALLFAQANIEAVRGRAFNLGGGPGNTISSLELVALIAAIHGKLPKVTFAEDRPYDRRFYVSDIRRFGAATGWKPRVHVREGVLRLYRWLIEEESAEDVGEAASTSREVAAPDRDALEFALWRD